MGRALNRFAGEGLRMALLSAFSLGLGYVLTSAMVRWGDVNPELAYSVAVIGCSVMNFFGCRYYVFCGTRDSIWREALKFFPSVLLFRAVEVALFAVIFDFSANYHVAYFATALISMAAKLLLSKLFIFRRPAL